MKIKVSPIVVGLTIFLIGLTSCLNDDTEEIALSSENSITALSLGTVKRLIVGKDSKGQDSAYVDTFSVSKYPFTIDQQRRVIENKDSLPVGVDLSKILLNISADSPYIFYGKIAEKGGEAKDTLWVATDSIDFSVAPEEGLAFKVYAYSGTIGATYHIKVNVHKQEPDSLQWSRKLYTSGFSKELTKQKAVFVDGKICVLGENNGEAHLESSVVANGIPGEWTSLILPEGTDTYSATAVGSVIYFLANQELYEIRDTEVVKSGNSRNDLAQLVAGSTLSDGTEARLYAQTVNGKSVTYHATSGWSEEESISLPAGMHFVYDTIPVSYNKKLKRTVAMGYQSGGDFGFVASRLTNDDSWSVYDYEKVDTFQCPNIENPTLIYYDKKLCAFGGSIGGEDFSEYKDPFSAIFVSTDNGLTWKPATHSLVFAREEDEQTFTQLYEESEGTYSCVVDSDHFIWLIWRNGTMSRGRVNHYGFVPKVW